MIIDRICKARLLLMNEVKCRTVVIERRQLTILITKISPNFAYWREQRTIETHPLTQKKKQTNKTEEKKEKEKWQVCASWEQIKDEELRTNWGLNQVSSFMIYLDKGSGCITGSHYSAQCTELHRGPVEDWCRFVIGPAFLLHMFCYICSTIPTESNYHSLLFEQKKRWYSIVLNRIRKEWLILKMLIPSLILERMQPFGCFHWSVKFETCAYAGKCNAVVADHITINDLKEFHQKENKQTNQNSKQNSALWQGLRS